MSLKDKLCGKAKEVEGKLTGDKAREVQGKAQEVLGKAKDVAQEAVEKVADKCGCDCHK